VLTPKESVRRVGRFVLHEQLGRGAQATVWRAHDERLDRDVALKLLDPRADTVAVSQWLHEARAVSRLAHPNIVPVFEAAEDGGQAHLVFELVRGPTLAERLRKDGAMAPQAAVQLMLGVLDALVAAHAEGIVHRDLKPSNILIDGSGRPRVMDFGIAARVADNSDGRIIGTPGYISPEAAAGAPPAASMDLFSAGMVLAEMLAGRPLLRISHPLIRKIHRHAVDAGLDHAAHQFFVAHAPGAHVKAGTAQTHDEFRRDAVGLGAQGRCTAAAAGHGQAIGAEQPVQRHGLGRRGRVGTRRRGQQDHEQRHGRRGVQQ